LAARKGVSLGQKSLTVAVNHVGRFRFVPPNAWARFPLDGANRMEKPMFAGKTTKVMAALAVLSATISPLNAGGRAVDCYERYSTPPVYGSVTENVQVHPGYTHVEVTPPIYGTATREVPVVGQRIVHRRTPATYAYHEERVLLEPGRTIKRRAPAVLETRYKTVKVAGGYVWERRIINGKKVLCKVKLPARYEQVAYQVKVRNGGWVYEQAAPRYGYKTRKVLVTPESTESYVLVPEYETIVEPVLIQPKRVRHYDVAPSYRTRTRDVLVSPGEEGWKRIRLRCH
jgi:hypothetical protein